MNNVLKCLFSLSFFCFSLIQAQVPTDFEWVKKASGTKTEVGYDVAADSDSNVYVTGYYKGTTFWGSDSAVSIGGKDVFIAKYDASGNLLWHDEFGSTSDDIGYGIITDADKNVYITGSFSSTLTVGGSINLTSNGLFDAFVVKYNSSGKAIWGISYGSTTTDNGEDITLDVNNNLIITGAFQGTLDFGGQSLTSAGQSDIYVAKYDTSGTLVTAFKSGGPSGDDSKSVVTDAAGNIFITGWFSGTATIAGTSLTSSGNFDAYIAKFNSAGTGVWAYKAAGSGAAYEYGHGITADKDGNVIYTGYYDGTSITFSSNSGSSIQLSNGKWEIFVAKYNNNGDIKWVNSYGGSNYDYAYDVKADYNKDIIIVGGIEAEVSFGGIIITTTNGTSSVIDDMFVLKLDSNGTPKWVMNVGSSGPNYVWNESVALDKNGNVLFTGTMEGIAAFGTTNLISSGGDELYGEDMFVGKINQSAKEPASLKNIAAKETSVNAVIKIYPNPCNGSFKIEMEETLGTSVTITNMLGIVICSQKINNQLSANINMNNEPSGIYLLSLQTQEGMYFKKLIKE